MDTIRGLERYMEKYASMCNTYKGHCKVMALARREMNRDVRAEKAKKEKEEADAASKPIADMTYSA